MKELKYWIVAALLCVVVSACGGDDDDFGPSIISDDPQPMTELDEWLHENFGVYNMDVIYKWNDFQTNQEYELIPPMEHTVIPCMEVIRRIWMEPYLELGGEVFFKKTAPKQIMLLGSPVYLDDGNRVVGEADQGMRITLYDLNNRNPTDPTVVANYTQIFHHEFVHILHQTIDYPQAFEQLCQGKYTIEWESVTMDESQGQGFISPYAMADPNEDFAEMVSRYIISDATEWQYHFNQAQSQSAEAYRILREKEAIVLQYMRANWGIDLLELRTLVHAELAKIEEENAAGGQTEQ